MDDLLRRRRLGHQRLTATPARTPVDVVSSLGAMQSQDYAGAKWAIGLRSTATDEDVERACDDGSIIRTHILRQTWHFVARNDLRWMLALSGPRVNALNAHYYRKLGLDGRTFARSHEAIERALRGGTHLTRNELGTALRRARIEASGVRMAFLTMHAELDRLICSGPRRGLQFTYALIDERIPPSKALDRDAALAELTRRYFASHGPATLRDYAWWSGLTMKDAKTGIALASLVQENVDGLTYWSVEGRTPRGTRSTSAWLLPNYDEYLIAYKDRGLVVGPGSGDGVIRIKDPFVHHIVVDGTLAGSWKRTVTANALMVETATYQRPPETTKRAIDSAIARLGKFLNLPATSSSAGRR